MIEEAKAIVDLFPTLEQHSNHLNKKCSKKIGGNPTTIARERVIWSQWLNNFVWWRTFDSADSRLRGLLVITSTICLSFHSYSYKFTISITDFVKSDIGPVSSHSHQWLAGHSWRQPRLSTPRGLQL
jgi:hypothetical protein